MKGLHIEKGMLFFLHTLFPNLFWGLAISLYAHTKIFCNVILSNITRTFWILEYEAYVFIKEPCIYQRIVRGICEKNKRKLFFNFSEVKPRLFTYSSGVLLDRLCNNQKSRGARLHTQNQDCFNMFKTGKYRENHLYQII